MRAPRGIGWAVVEDWDNTIVRGDLLFVEAEELVARYATPVHHLDIVPTEEALQTHYLRDSDYDSGRDRRMCELCPFIAYGGSTATSWEIHDHMKEEHPDGR